MADIITRGSTVTLSFTFTDENGDAASVDSAELELTYRVIREYRTETLTLSESDGVWSTTWDSARASAGWVDYHAHAISGSAEFAEDGRFKIRGNRAGHNHDPLSTTGTDYGARDE